MKHVLFVLGLFLLSLPAFAQENYTLSGTVTLNEEPLAGANVMVKNRDEATITNFDGEYSLQLPAGDYTLIFSYGNQKEVEVNLTGNQTLDVDLTNAEETLDEVFLSSIRVDADSPITYSNLSNEEIAERNLGQDIPVLMNYLPSVVTTTDAGNGVGYTGIRVRGSDATRTNVTVNGIPINDAESQGTFWVNMGDFASSTENIQLQRGVGTSTNGAGAFGASINILTDRYSEEAFAEIANSYGSFNTRKHTAKFGTGLIDDHWSFTGRASQIKSDGYIDRAESDLKSYFLQGSYVNNGTIVKAIMFGGKERTYQAWYGVEQSTINERGRRYNPAGIYFDEDGNEKFYDNQTDNYQQDHYQLLWNQKFDNNWSTNLAFHYTRGKGYYEEYEEDASLVDFGLTPFMANGEEVTTSDLVNTSWLDNHFYGTTFSANYQNEKLDLVLGGGFYSKALFCLIGEMKIGKSIWLANLAANSVRLGYNTAVISLEMRDRKLVKRLGANLLNISMREYGQAAEDKVMMKKKLANMGYDSLQVPGKLYVKEFPTSSAGVPDIERYLQKMEEMKGIKFKVIILDYINILKNWRNPNSENMYMKIKQIAEDLRAMAMRNDWAIVTATQINRSGFGSTDLNATNISESAALGHTVDAMFGIIQDEIMHANREYILKLIANRDDGYKNSRRKFLINYDYMRIMEDPDSTIITE